MFDFLKRKEPGLLEAVHAAVKTHGGVFLAEDHTAGVANAYIEGHAADLLKAGVKTMYVEWICSEHQPLLDAFQRREIPAEGMVEVMVRQNFHLLAQLLREGDLPVSEHENFFKEVREKFSLHIDAVTALRDAGIRLVAIDTLPSLQDQALDYRIRIPDSNPHWVETIQADRARSPDEGFAVWGGAAHSSAVNHIERYAGLKYDVVEKNAVDRQLGIPVLDLQPTNRYATPPIAAERYVSGGITSQVFQLPNHRPEFYNDVTIATERCRMAHYRLREKAGTTFAPAHAAHYSESSRESTLAWQDETNYSEAYQKSKDVAEHLYEWMQRTLPKQLSPVEQNAVGELIQNMLESRHAPLLKSSEPIPEFAAGKYAPLTAFLSDLTHEIANHPALSAIAERKERETGRDAETWCLRMQNITSGISANLTRS